MITNFIGNTPLIKLHYFSSITNCNIYGKAEFMNPGGSIKDRAAKYIIENALKHNLIKEGGVIVEGTAGNTGIGLALVGNGVLWANQFDNDINYLGHELDTGPEIINQFDKEIHGFICSVGTGGTLTGVSLALRKKYADIKIGLADPYGAALFNYYNNGELKSEGSSVTEGIGQGRITKNLEALKVDFAYQIPDSEALEVMFDLVKKEGLYLGGSSGINVAGAMRLAKDIGPGKNIITILCDSGSRYQSKLYDRNFLLGNDLPCPDWL
jgi:cysteine synthase A